MAGVFHLKLITQRAGGGDPIIREREVAGPTLNLGRETDNDIVLADLAIDPRHARATLTGPGRVTLESVSGLSFQVDGRDVQRADLNLSARPVVAFASYHLTFAIAEDGGCAVTVERDDHADPKSPSVFSLKAPVFGRRNMAWALGAGIFLICLLVPLFASDLLSPAKIHPDQQWSSGPLSKSHAFLETDCKACHTNAFVSVRDDACLDCHKAEADPAARAITIARSAELGSPFEPRLVFDHATPDRLAKGTPLPSGPAMVGALVQRAFNHPTDRCASCHIEHTKPTPIADEDPKAPLADKPTLVEVNDCQSCHTGLSGRLGKTDLIDTPDWGRHPAFRPLVVTAAGDRPTLQRIPLSRGPQERNGLIFPHDVHLSATGGVARQAIVLGKAAGYGGPLDCASCHRADVSGQGFKPIEMERDCGDCHSLAYTRVDGQLRNLPHGELQKVVDTLAGRTLTSSAGDNRARPGMIRPTAFAASGASAYRATFSPGGACYDCHTITWAGDTVRMAPVSLTDRYLPRGAFDHSVPEHGGPGGPKPGAAKCADCHKTTTSARSSDLLLPTLAQCATCHGKTTAQTPAADDADCTTCHSFHAPGQSTPAPGHPPLESLRWKADKIARRGAGA